jgi:hypothetical protein
MNARTDTGMNLPAAAPAVSVEPPTPALIARHRGDDPFAYDALRAQALASLQALSGERWTDYNYHDPGVTLLDALCFALTEDLFGAQQPLLDLITAPDGRIHYRRLGLCAAEEILPSRACTGMDYMRWLLDRVPGTLQAHALMAGNGLWRMSMEVTTEQTDEAPAAAARAFWAQRNLCEDLENVPTVLQPRWCTLQLQMSIEGARTPEEILAEVVARCADHVDAAPRRHSLMERVNARHADTSLAELLDGPRLRQGWIDTGSLERDLDSRVYFGDLARLALAVDGVSDVSAVSLVADGMDSSGGSLPRRGQGWVLRLRWPDRHEAMQQWQIKRRANPIGLNEDALLHRLDDLRRNTGGRAAADSSPTMVGSPLMRPQGEYLRPERYVSLYLQLPRIYRERFDLATNAVDAARTQQFGAYLALLEQWLAHGSAQTHHLRELYTVSPALRPSYAWQVLGDDQIPGLGALYATDRERIRETVFAPADAMLERRGRVLDHLLALYGEGCWQGSIRPFGWYFSAETWPLHLFEQKRRMLRRIATLTRDRYGAIDYSRRSLDRRGNTSALQQRVSLLLAFKYHHSRMLMAPMRKARIGLAAENAAPPTAKLPSDAQPPTLWNPRRRRVVESMGTDLASAARVLSLLFSGLDARALPPALLRSAVHAERYRHADAQSIWLSGDDRQGCWRLRLSSNRVTAEAAAICLHEFACRLQLECEGMHVIEHVLLRPWKGGDPNIPDDFYPYRLTAVFPAWTARGQDASFRRVASETLALNAPAHLRLQTLWLDAPAMQRFERSYAAWLEAKQAHCAAVLAGDDEQAAQRLEDWARLLRWLLWRHLDAAMHSPGSVA